MKASGWIGLSAFFTLMLFTAYTIGTRQVKPLPVKDGKPQCCGQIQICVPFSEQDKAYLTSEKGIEDIRKNGITFKDKQAEDFVKALLANCK